MKLIARIIVEVDAESFAVAADHEREFRGAYQTLRAVYPDCKLEIKQLRTARRAQDQDELQQKPGGRSGKISHYAD